jgi:beta-glucanase (GH16 family)
MRRVAAGLCIAVAVLSAGSVSHAATVRPTLTWGGHRWTVYSAGKWDASHTYVRDGILNLAVHDGLGGGVTMGGGKMRTHGRWTVRFRMTRGFGSRFVFLLWPNTGVRPEIDFAESRNGDGARHILTASLHHGPTKADANGVDRVCTRTDSTQWHTARVVWHHHVIRYVLDGRTWATMTDRIPQVPMHLAIQTTAYDGGGRPAVLQVRRVVVGN